MRYALASTRAEAEADHAALSETLSAFDGWAVAVPEEHAAYWAPLADEIITWTHKARPASRKTPKTVTELIAVRRPAGRDPLFGVANTLKTPEHVDLPDAPGDEAVRKPERWLLWLAAAMGLDPSQDELSDFTGTAPVSALDGMIPLGLERKAYA